MNLERLLAGLEVIQLSGEVERKDVVDISYDSRKVKRNSLFVAVKGFNVDGHDFVMEAIAKGATVIVIEDDSKISNDYLVHQNVTKILVKDSRKALAVLSNNFYEKPSTRLKIIGVTGTNGKTTTTYVIKSILERAGYKTGLIGTIQNFIGDTVIPAEKTTPESPKINDLFTRMVEAGCKYCVMEVSSHSLELNRVYGVNFTGAIFTNLTQEHLDFHKTMENYFNAKKKLFDELNLDAIAIVNIDDEYGKKITLDCKAKIVSYGSSLEADYRFVEPKISMNGIEFILFAKGENYSVKSNLIGRFNIYNLLGSIATCAELGIDIPVIVESMRNLKPIPGRFEVVGNYPVKVIVDYAHTPDALENVLSTIRDILKYEFSNSRVFTVFGAGGDRDRTKRPFMGKIVQSLSDVVIITNDNPRFELPSQIFNDILSGLELNENVLVIEDREEAIKRAIQMARNGDVILVAGKGHENFQIIKDKVIPFNDREVVERYLIKRFNT